MIQLDSLTLGYGSDVLLNNVSASLEEGGLIALLGRNGSGKSTLLRAIAGLGEIKEGKILIGGKVLSCLKTDELARIVSFVTTEKVRVPNLKCRDVVALGRAPYTNWSGRLQSRDWKIMIARALAQDTPVILLDEPTSFLDLPNRYELGVLLRGLAHRKNKCIFFSTHELDIALTLCDSIALIDRPRLHYLPTGQMITSGHIERLFQNETVTFDARELRVIVR